MQQHVQQLQEESCAETRMQKMADAYDERKARKKQRLVDEFYHRYIPWLDDSSTDCQEYYTYRAYLPWDHENMTEERWRLENPDLEKDFLLPDGNRP